MPARRLGLALRQFSVFVVCVLHRDLYKAMRTNTLFGFRNKVKYYFDEAAVRPSIGLLLPVVFAEPAEPLVNFSRALLWLSCLPSHLSAEGSIMF